MLAFVLLLVAIATMRFVARHFWERHYHHVAIALALLMAIYYVLVLPATPLGGAAGNFLQAHAGGALAKWLADYLSFIFLVASLFIVSGGILIRVRRTATPGFNTALLLAGELLANVLGTTGAAMLLIRPYLRMNKAHLRPYHIVFFIFLVANVGGCLTPIGDPPLFLGYLKGIPFWWFAQACWPMWGIAVGLLLVIFFVFDTKAQRRQKRADPDDSGPAISIYGSVNLFLIVAILAGLLLHDRLTQWVAIPWELVMAAAACISLAITPHKIHAENVFNFASIREVAFLFLGIFTTMVPALNYLANHAAEVVKPAFAGAVLFRVGDAVGDPGQWPPTYLTFLEAQIGPSHLADREAIAAILADPVAVRSLLAISLASVFFGAAMYIGNGPNFMVKSIADHAQGSGEANRCPSFFAYIFRYALPILGPILVLIWLLFLR